MYDCYQYSAFWEQKIHWGFSTILVWNNNLLGLINNNLYKVCLGVIFSCLQNLKL